MYSPHFMTQCMRQRLVLSLRTKFTPRCPKHTFITEDQQITKNNKKWDERSASRYEIQIVINLWYEPQFAPKSHVRLVEIKGTCFWQPSNRRQNFRYQPTSNSGLYIYRVHWRQTGQRWGGGYLCSYKCWHQVDILSLFKISIDYERRLS